MGEQSQEFFEGFSPAMVIAYIHSEMGEDALREFLNMLIDPTDAQLVEQCTALFGTVIPHDLKVLEEMTVPLEAYASELADMGLRRVADIVAEAI